MSNLNPPAYPLLSAELPSSCVIRGLDQIVHEETLNTQLERIYSLKSESSNKKKRGAEAQQNSRLNNEIKRRLTIKDEDLVSDREGEDPLRDEDMEDEDNNLANQVRDSLITPITTSSAVSALSPPSETSQSFESSDLPLPSPSASPRQSSFNDDDMNDTQDQVTSQIQNSISSKTLINAIENLATTTLPKNALNNLIFKLISQADRSVLSDFRHSIDQGLKRDFLSNLPTEISFKILKELDYKSLNNVLLVSRSWNRLISGDFWKNLLIKDNFVSKDELKALCPVSPEAHNLYVKRFNLHRNWRNPLFEPKKITIPAHGANVVTCLLFDEEKIISGADDKMINIYNPENGEVVKILQGHEGGVWALKYIGNQIISGSTDKSVRVWNIETGKCTHVFKGHTSTIRCMDLVTDEETGKTLIVTGSRDNTLHVWRLPDEDDDGSSFDENAENNPFLICTLIGHTQSVRAIVGADNIIVSGSYDHTVRVWDLATKECKFVLKGHTDRIYAIQLDIERNRCISASMDSTIRVWDLATGKCLAELTNHTSLVGLLGLSSKFLVSAAADGTLRGWDPSFYKNEFTLHHDNHAAITTFYASPNLLVSGSEGQFNLYDLRNKGKLIRSDLLTDFGQIWSTKFNHGKCIVALERNSQSFIEILDFNTHA